MFHSAYTTIDRCRVDEDGNRITKIDTQFCSIKCKNDFHNTARKAQRKIEAIKKSWEELEEINRQYGHHHEFWFIDQSRDKLVEKISTRDFTF